MRRVILEEPVSRAALWSRRLAVFALGLMLAAIVLSRLNWAEPPAALAVLGAGLAIAGAAIGAAMIAAVVIWRTGHGGIGAAVSGALLALIICGYPAYLGLAAYRSPKLDDISTDLANPPAFLRTSKALKARNDYVPPEIAPEARSAQATAYPLIQPIVLDLEPKETLPLVIKSLMALKWRVIDQELPSARSDTTRIDALAHSLIMNFPQDLAIRIRPLGTGTRIDLRAVSRLGPYDAGAGAGLIRKFVDQLQTQLEAR
ncbi:DUF1499 domain-containing protein [Methylovirgula sp. 4M-Z18]|uniref:DUF1499 domain-containing protein n=1 Tax=Methylovirgula sp. 4M-Z18 TaxID=2293567 RepID=UPI000E2E9E0A|nr:DUF1499 domain-containing protein [Methylovirgula sp. 4M-Z18]RFB78159.1 DUF1499 domain-containing protein [Methylovirgula sp. 4M-Z18]